MVFLPAALQKRLGDGFYEQHILNGQVAKFYGRRFLGDYTSDETQYQTLMDAGITTLQSCSNLHRKFS